MSRSPLRNACGLLGAVIVSTMAYAGTASAQSVLVDYESSAKAAQIREGAAWRLAFRPTLQVLQQTVSQLRNSPGVSAAIQAETDGLLKTAAAQAEPEARRTYWRAVSLLTGVAWTPEQELLGALALRFPSTISTGAGDRVSFEATYPTATKAPASFTVDLYRTEPTTSATPKRGGLVRAVAKGKLDGRLPRPVEVNLSGVADGSYLLIAKVSAGSAASTELVQPIYIVRDLDRRHAALTRDLSGVQGHAEARWIAEYPFVLAKAIKAGAREVVSYDFPAALDRSAKIVADLKAGRDPVRQVRGLQNRAYAFPETGELVPYQTYVPSNWTPDRTWPLMVALHGANLDETNMLGRDDARMQKLAEQYGFVVVTPLGYRLNSAYGSQRGMGSIVGDQTERRRRSEVDVLQVTEIVSKEYNIDPKRRYLTGNSMGGGGTWWIGGRHAELWAAIAPAAYGGVLPEDVAAFKGMPILAVVGDRDELGMLDRVRQSVATLKAGGVKPGYVEVPGGTHAGAFERTLPQIFEFFDKHSK